MDPIAIAVAIVTALTGAVVYLFKSEEKRRSAGEQKCTERVSRLEVKVEGLHSSIVKSTKEEVEKAERREEREQIRTEKLTEVIRCNNRAIAEVTNVMHSTAIVVQAATRALGENRKRSSSISDSSASLRLRQEANAESDDS